MAQNLTQEETRKLERQRLAESMLYYPAEGDAHQVEARTAPAAPDGIDNLSEQIDALPNLGNEEKALAKAFGIASVAGRNRGKIMNLAEKPDPLAQTTIAWWRLDFTGDTWQNIIGYELQPNVAAADQRRFASFKLVHIPTICQKWLLTRLTKFRGKLFFLNITFNFLFMMLSLPGMSRPRTLLCWTTM